MAEMCPKKGEDEKTDTVFRMTMEDNIFDKVHEVDLKKTMENSYIDYAMSVIASRADRKSVV